jgi:hypothetical protein
MDALLDDMAVLRHVHATYIWVFGVSVCTACGARRGGGQSYNGESHNATLISDNQLIAQPKATALLYTLRTLGGTLGIAIGGSVQIGVLASELKKWLPDSDDKSTVS